MSYAYIYKCLTDVDVVGCRVFSTRGSQEYIHTHTYRYHSSVGVPLRFLISDLLIITRIHTFTHMYIHVYIHTHTHTYTYIYIYTTLQ